MAKKAEEKKGKKEEKKEKKKTPVAPIQKGETELDKKFREEDLPPYF